MKNKRPIFTYPQKMQGFSLIEFLVASALSMIVLMAVTSSYFTARNLNNAATSRLSVQQELRNASTLLVRDARMAGSFGCFNMAGYGASSVITDTGKEPFKLANNPGKDSLIPIFKTTVNGSDALAFQYGIDDVNPDSGLAIASSCTSIAKSANIKNLDTAKSVLKLIGNDKNGTVSILKHVVVAYAATSIQGQKGLYRYQLMPNGTWGDPQLLIKNIDSMAVNYTYVDNCPESVVSNAASSTSLETFSTETKLRTGTDAVTPALIQLRLNGGKEVEASSDNAVHVYNIDATVRGGNVCADRSI